MGESTCLHSLSVFYSLASTLIYCFLIRSVVQVQEKSIHSMSTPQDLSSWSLTFFASVASSIVATETPSGIVICSSLLYADSPSFDTVMSSGKSSPPTASVLLK